jgi:hypothetical protein
MTVLPDIVNFPVVLLCFEPQINTMDQIDKHTVVKPSLINAGNARAKLYTRSNVSQCVSVRDCGGV